MYCSAVRVISTHEWAGLGNMVSDVKKTCIEANVDTKGLAIKGSQAKASINSSLSISSLIYSISIDIKSEMHNDRRPSIFISIDGYGRSGKHYGMLDDCKTKTGSAGLF